MRLFTTGGKESFSMQNRPVFDQLYGALVEHTGIASFEARKKVGDSFFPGIF